MQEAFSLRTRILIPLRTNYIYVSVCLANKNSKNNNDFNCKQLIVNSRHMIKFIKTAVQLKSIQIHTKCTRLASELRSSSKWYANLMHFIQLHILHQTTPLHTTEDRLAIDNSNNRVIQINFKEPCNKATVNVLCKQRKKNKRRKKNKCARAFDTNDTEFKIQTNRETRNNDISKSISRCNAWQSVCLVSKKSTKNHCI